MDPLGTVTIRPRISCASNGRAQASHLASTSASGVVKACKGDCLVPVGDLTEEDEKREWAFPDWAVGVVSFEEDTGVLLLVKDPRDLAMVGVEFFIGVLWPEDDPGDPKSVLLRK